MNSALALAVPPTPARRLAVPVRDASATPVGIVRGDGIGPEIMDATLAILEAAGARLLPRTIELGERAVDRGHSSGIDPEAWAALREQPVLLKGPIATPQGRGLKSVNVTIRKALGLYANVRPCAALHPYVATLHPEMDVIVVRENEEDLYAGIEHRQTDEVTQCLKLVSWPGCERIVRYAFELARASGRRKVSCFTKDNIMKMTDGLFHQAFERIAREYPELESEHLIVDIGAARLATRPDRFDVLVLPNLYGDILSDVAAELAGSVGLAGSANIGEHGAMFEAVHGTAPAIAGKDLANPSGLLSAALLMLRHIGQHEPAARTRDAWLRTLEDGVHTFDLYRSGASTRKAGTQAFARAVIERLGESPRRLRAAQIRLPEARPLHAAGPLRPRITRKHLVGVDVFLHWSGRNPQVLAERLRLMRSAPFTLTMITNRGVKVWPDGLPETFCVDHWRCRFTLPEPPGAAGHARVVELLRRLQAAGFDFIKTENLYTFDGEAGYSLGQGQ